MGKKSSEFFILFFTFLFLHSGFVLGQNQHKIDSIKVINLVETNNETIVNNYNSIADLFALTDVDSAFLYANKALELAKQIKFKEGEAKAYFLLAYYYDQTGEFIKAIDNLEKASNNIIEMGDLIHLAGCYNNLGVLYSYGINKKKSLEYFIKSLNISEKLNETYAQSQVYGNIAAIYKNLKEYSSSLKYYNKSLAVGLKLENLENIALSYIDVGKINVKLQRYDNALDNFISAKKLISEIKDKYRLTQTYIDFANYYIDTNQPDSAKVYINLAKNINDSINYPRLKTDIICLKADLLLNEKKYEDCLNLYDQAIGLYKQLQIHDALNELYLSKAKAFSELGKSVEAYKFIQMANEIDESFKPNEIVKLLGKFELEEASKEERTRLLIEQELVNQKNQNDIIHIRYNLQIAIFSIVLLVILIAIVLYFYVSKRKHNAQLELNYKTIDNQKYLLEENFKKLEINQKKLIELNATKDKFFSIIAHDLKNPFNVLIGLSDIMIRNPEIRNSHDFEQLIDGMFQTATSGYNLLENLLEWARAQTGSIEFNPDSLVLNEILTLNASFFEETAKAKGINICIENPSKERVLADYNMVNCIVRNLINNAIKFSYQKSKIEVSTHQENEFCIITVQDYGVGMSIDTVNKLFKIENTIQKVGTADERGTGLGLILCKEFVEINGGKIWVESKEGEGSQFYFSLPAYKS
ncbi:MAG: tetratricopeptide repeat-containing sensor histidine kinase [Bacteroidetes bacterium]|nr:tetratricopeptide repeat-containing sensor histidine kinase [Bacteroidota bacterium]